MRRPKVTLVRGPPGPGAAPGLPAVELATHLTDDMTDQHFVTSASSAQALTVILDVAMRGASLTVMIEQPLSDEAAFLDELRRVADVSEPGVVMLDPVAMALLELLAAGESTDRAARRLHLSTRSAYRMLGVVRTTLGVSSNMEALLIARSGSGTASDP